MVFVSTPADAQADAPGDRLTQFDIDPLPGDGNKSARGVCSDGTTLWVVEERALKLFAYTLLEDGSSRNEAADIQLDVYENYGPGGCTSDGTTIWVADDEFDTLVAYDISGAARAKNRDIDTLSDAGNSNVTGVTLTGPIVWVADTQDKKLFAYAVQDGSRDSARDLPLHTQEINPVGIWTNGVTMWVADNSNGHFYAYTLATKARDMAKELTAADTTNVQGIWSSGSVLWAANRVDRSNAGNKVLAYQLQAPLSSDATLSELELSGATLEPVFSTETTAYTASVGHEVSETTVTSALGDADAQVKTTPVDADDQASGHQVSLPVGETAIEITVTAADGETTQTYRVTVTRAASSNATLSELALTDDGDSAVTLEPAFASETTAYTASVGNAVSAVTVTPVVAGEGAGYVIEVDGVEDEDGTVPLAVGETAIEVVVTAADGETTQTYRVTMTRAASSNARLSGLALTDSGGSTVTLEPAFASETTGYTASVDNAVSAVTVTPVVAGEGAGYVIEVDGVVDEDGIVPLAVGETAIEVTVTAADGETTSIYSVTVTRTASSNATLSGLALTDDGDSAVTLEPAFVAETTGYTALVGNAVSAVTVTPVVAGEGAGYVIEVDGMVDEDGIVPLVVGETAIEVMVTAADGKTTQTYRVTVTRAASSDARLSGLALTDDGGSAVTLEPEFTEETTAYTASVGNGVSAVTVTPVVGDEGAGYVIEVDDVADEDEIVPLAMGETGIEVTVTAADGETTQTYRVTVTRAASSDARLSGLTLTDDRDSAVTLEPAFASETTAYTASVGNGVSAVTVTPVVAGEGAGYVIEVDGVVDEDGIVPLAVGETAIEVMVTAADGESTVTYAVKVTRAASSDATLSGLALTDSGGSTVTLEPAFASETTGYTASVVNEVSAVTVTPVVAGEGAGYVIEVDGVVDEDGIVPLAVGETVVEVTVTAAEGETTQTYRVTVTREASADATLSELALIGVALSPPFNSGHPGYAAVVAYGVERVTVTAEPSDLQADVTISPLDADDGTPGHQVELAVGTNAISIFVTGSDGVTQWEYVVEVTRQAKPNAELKNLTISGARLIPSFDPNTLYYAVELEHDVHIVRVEASPDDTEAAVVITLDGVMDEDGTLALPRGSSVIQTVVTAKDGEVSQTYTVLVIRARQQPVPLPTQVRPEDPPTPLPTAVPPTATPTAIASGIGISTTRVDMRVDATHGSKAQAALTVWNRRSGRMLFNFSNDVPWLHASPPFAVSTGPGDPKTVTLTADAWFMGPGSHSAAFYVHVDGVSHSPMVVAVTLTIPPRPTPTPKPTATPTAVPAPTPLPAPASTASPVPTATTLPEAVSPPAPLPPDPVPAPTTNPAETPTPVPLPLVSVLVGSEDTPTSAKELVTASAEVGPSPIAEADKPMPLAAATGPPIAKPARVTVMYTSTGTNRGAGKRAWAFLPGIVLIDVLSGWRLRRRGYAE